VRRLVLLVLPPLAAGCALAGTKASPPPSPYCRPGDPLAGVYHPSRLHVRSRCAVASGTVEKVKFEEFDGDVHVDLRLDDPYRKLLSSGNEQVRGDLVVEVIPRDRSTVPIPEVGARVTVVGPWVDDEAHGWREIHPAWWISQGHVLPATPRELERAETLLRTGSSSDTE
jgi:hypothetical protein